MEKGTSPIERKKGMKENNLHSYHSAKLKRKIYLTKQDFNH